MKNSYIEEMFEKYLAIFSEEKNNFPELRDQLVDGKPIASRTNYVGHITASGLVIHEGKIILIFHNKLQKYIQPGGHIEEDTTLWEAAKREVQEELGLSQVELHPWHIDHDYIPLHIDTHVIPFNEKKQEPQHFHHDHVFMFKTSIQDIHLQQEEVSRFQWVSVDAPFEEKLLKNAVSKIITLQIK